MASRSTYYTDKAATVDSLDFGDFRPVLAEVLLYADTPLTVAIYGPWGSGKTTLLKMLRKDIELSETPQVRTMWFTAWKYDRQEALWRAFLLRVLDALYPRKRHGDNFDEWQRLKPDELTPKEKDQVEKLQRLEESVYRTVEWQDLGRWTAEWSRLLPNAGSAAGILAEIFLPGGQLINKAIRSLAGKKDDDPNLTESLAAIRREVQSHRLEQLTSMEQFESTFSEALKLALGDNGRLIVFVDDLDRCLPEKAIEVLETIKLFFEVEGTIFVLGMDKQVIEHGIDLRYKTYYDQKMGDSLISGDDYLQKIVQIPFFLPPIGEDAIGKLIQKTEESSQLRDFDVEHMVQRLAKHRGIGIMTQRILKRGVARNPRQVKRVLNVFRLLQSIGLVREWKGSLPSRSVAWPLLAKTVIIQSQFPELYQQWLREPRLVVWLEKAYRQSDVTENTEEPDNEVRQKLLEPFLHATHWQRYEALRRLLVYPEEYGYESERDRAHFTGLSLADLQVYLQLVGSVDLEGARAEELGDIWNRLASGERDQVKSATGLLLNEHSDDERLKAQWLLLRRLQDTREPQTNKIAWAEALGKLGRNTEALQYLNHAVRNPEDNHNLWLSAEILSDFRHLPLLAQLKAWAEDADKNIRRCAFQCLVRFSEDATTTFNSLTGNRSPVTVRAEAAEALAQMDHPRALEILVRLLRDKSAKVRSQAVESIGNRQPQTLIPMLGDSSDLVRESATDVLSGSFDEVSSELAQILLSTDPDGRVKDSTLRVVERAGPQAVRNMLDLFVQIESDAILGREAQAVAMTLEILSCTPSPEINSGVASRFLARLGKPGVDPLLKNLKDETASQHHAIVIQALGEIGDVRGLGPSINALRRLGPHARDSLGRAINGMWNKEALDKISSLLDTAPAVRLETLDILISVRQQTILQDFSSREGSPIMQDLIRALHKAHPEIRSAAARECDDSQIRSLAQFLGHTDEELQDATIDLIVRKGQDAIPILLDYVDSGEEDTSRMDQVLEAFRRMGPDISDILIKNLNRQGLAGVVAVRVLGELDEGRSLRAIVSAFKFSDPTIQREILGAIRHFWRKGALHEILKLVTNEKLRRDMMDILAALGEPELVQELTPTLGKSFLEELYSLRFSDNPLVSEGASLITEYEEL